MPQLESKINIVDPRNVDGKTFIRSFSDCVVLTKDGTILLQQRPAKGNAIMGALTAFGGHIEPDESPMGALIRELKEELGADVVAEDVVFIGAITEDFTQHSEIVHCHFWHDRNGTITGCYEWDPVHYSCAEDALSHPEIMDYLRWLLQECRSRRLIE